MKNIIVLTNIVCSALKMPDKNCELIERDDFYEVFSSGAAIVELHRIIQQVTVK